jgi:hypothetical protein
MIVSEERDVTGPSRRLHKVLLAYLRAPMLRAGRGATA